MKQFCKMLAVWLVCLNMAAGFVWASQDAPSLPLAHPARVDPQTGFPLLPDPVLTPGDVLAVTKSDVCVSGYSSKVRNVPIATKRQVYKLYRLANQPTGAFEVDHLISLELGGSNSIKNLWPQSYKTQPYNAHVKDRLENALHADVCSGAITLQDAQTAISKDWIAEYERRYGSKEDANAGSSK